ncbi:MAG TPA: VOC family protein [Clostridia bacterium]|nr:VOC family protein [Clostridia bacterium]
MIRYSHTNLIALDVPNMIAFYRDVLGCRSIGQTRDLSGSWVDRLTGIPGAHIFGEHLALPGYDDGGPTLEIFGYDGVIPHAAPGVNASGFTHLAFAVENVAAMLAQVLLHGGGQIGELVETQYADGRVLTVVYATDPEGNIIELQSWRNGD